MKAMILKFSGLFGSTVGLNGIGEIQGYEFLQPPIEYRFVRAGSPISDWMFPEPRYILLLRPGPHQRGCSDETNNLATETRGFAGTFTLLVWPRE